MSELRTGLGQENDPDAITRRIASSSSLSNGQVLPFPTVSSAPSAAPIAAPQTQPETRPGLPAIGPPEQSVAQRNIANNNPGNMKAPDGSYLSFPTREAGITAIGAWVDRAQTVHGLTTLRQLIDDPTHGYAPSADPGNRGKMLPEAAARIIGVSPDEPIDVSNPIIKQKLVNAILTQEQGGGTGGYRYSPEQSSGHAELQRVGEQTRRLIDAIVKEGGRSEETWKKLGEAQTKMQEYQERALKLAEHPPSTAPTDPMQKLGGLATIVGILGGLLTKAPLTASLNAAGAAMEGYNQNDQLTYKREVDQWKYHTDVLTKMAQFEHEQYRDILADERATVSERMNRLNMIAQLLGNDRMGAVTLIGDERSARQFAAQMGMANEKLELQKQEFYDLHRHRLVLEGGGTAGGTMHETKTYEVTQPGKATERISAREPAKGTGLIDPITGKKMEFPEGTKITPIPPSQAAGGRDSAQTQRQLISGKEVLSDLQNVVQLPTTTTAGIFGGRKQGPGLFDALKENFAQTVTNEDAELYTSALSGFQRELSILVSPVYGGQYASELFNGLGLKEGQTVLVKAYNLARIRQTADNALEGVLASPRLGDKQKEFASEIRAELQKAVPWTPHDVMAFRQQGDNRETFGDWVKEKGIKGAGGLPSDLPSPEGHPEGYVARDNATNEVVAVIRNGKWAKP